MPKRSKVAEPEAVGEGAVVMRRMLSVDPGDVHVGMAEFVETEESWECIDAYELGPDDAADKVAQYLVGGKLDLLIVEEFRLYPDKALSQSYSELVVVQLIGVLKYLHRISLNSWNDKYAELWGEAGVEPGGRVRPELVMQPAAIKEATRGILRASGVTSEAKRRKAGGHAADAELHGWYWILRDLGKA